MDLKNPKMVQINFFVSFFRFEKILHLQYVSKNKFYVFFKQKTTKSKQNHNKIETKTQQNQKIITKTNQQKRNILCYFLFCCV